jgi:hypothetical protein
MGVTLKNTNGDSNSNGDNLNWDLSTMRMGKSGWRKGELRKAEGRLYT